MRFVADLHVHSRFSRATSREADLAGYFRWARVKGIHLVGTGDFTHPRWLSEIESQLVEKDGLWEMREPPRGSPLEGAEPTDIPVRFLLTAEISSIYKKRGETRKVHSLIGVPTMDGARKLSARLSTIGNLASDGRPILGLDPKDLLEILLEEAPEGFLIPAHIWTSWFSLFGSKSGFDRIEDCFEELSPRIFALETGLSSDPSMNWRWSALDRFRLVSNSDAHSPANLGREANLFDSDFTYEGTVDALRTGFGFLGTFEFYPEEGKYHFDGHRKCGVRMDPEQTRDRRGSCPVCGKPLTVGVLNRVLALADRGAPKQPRQAEGFRYLIPLPELLSELAGTGTGSKAVAALHSRIVGEFGSEFTFLLDASPQDIERSLGFIFAEAIRRMREGKIHPEPGYDGEFGVIRVFEKSELESLRGQAALFSQEARQGPRTGRRAARAAGKAAPPQASGSADALGFTNGPESAQASETTPIALDPEQSAVIEANARASLVFAGPGTGKTRALVAWIANLVRSERARPDQVLALTFTNRAAAEIKGRLATALGRRAVESAEPGGPPPGTPQTGITAATFHSFCWSVLRERDPSLTTIYGAESREELLKVLVPGRIAGKPSELAGRIERHYDGTDPGDPRLLEIVGAYERGLKAIGAADISSLIHRLCELLRADDAALADLRARYRFIAVDELQDINHAQYELLRLLWGGAGAGDTSGAATLCIGDPDQAIYGFRGSDRRLFMRFGEEARARIFSLSRNYRSAGTIVRAAGALMEAARTPGIPPLAAARSEGARIEVFEAADPSEEGGFIAARIRDLVGGVDSVSVDQARARGGGSLSFSDIAVLFRTRAVRDALLPSLSRAGLPLAFREAAPLAAEEPFRYLVAALRLLANPRDPVSQLLLREHSARVRGSGVENFLARREALLEKIASTGIPAAIDEILAGPVRFDRSEPGVANGEEALRWAAEESGSDLPGFLSRVSLCARESEGPLRAERVACLTFHAAKGLEFPVVFIAGAEEGVTPLPEDLEEERRLFYVAVTRAEDSLIITHARNRRVHGQLVRMKPSRFLEEIPSDCRLATKRPGRRRARQLTLFD
jgi:uncharacterized protein (TIGR00375 family)